MKTNITSGTNVSLVMRLLKNARDGRVPTSPMKSRRARSAVLRGKMTKLSHAAAPIVAIESKKERSLRSGKTVGKRPTQIPALVHSAAIT
jgi:hypothetical protein